MQAIIKFKDGTEEHYQIERAVYEGAIVHFFNRDRFGNLCGHPITFSRDIDRIEVRGEHLKVDSRFKNNHKADLICTDDGSAAILHRDRYFLDHIVDSYIAVCYDRTAWEYPARRIKRITIGE